MVEYETLVNGKPLDKMAKKDKGSNTIAYLFIFVVVVVLIVIVIIVIFFGPSIGKSADGYGTWSQPIPGFCTNESRKCTETGARKVTEICIPNTITGRGCLLENGDQTFNPRITVEECNVVCRSSVWDTFENSCILNKTCASTGDVGVKTTVKTCVPNDNTGINACVEVEYLPLDTGGVTPSLKQYNVGDVIVGQTGCTNYSTLPCGIWQATLNNVNYTTTPLFGTYNTSSECQISVTPKYGNLQEGYTPNPMTCVTGRGNITPTDSTPSLNECLLLSNFPQSGQRCNNNFISPSDVINGTVPADDIVMCNGTYGGNNPKFLSPCRYFPDDIVDYGQGETMNILVSSFGLLITPDNRVIIPSQSPSTQGNISRLFDWRSSTLSGLQDVPISLIDYNINFRDTCTPEDIVFNTGLLTLFGIRNVINSTTIETIISTIISTDFIGWLSIKVVDGKRVAYWEQAPTAYDSPGTISTDAERFQVQINSPIDKTPLVGYPNTYIGSVNITIKTVNWEDIYVPTLQTLFGGDTDYILLNNITILLFSTNTSLCTRSLYGPKNCNLLHSLNDLDSGPVCLDNVTYII